MKQNVLLLIEKFKNSHLKWMTKVELMIFSELNTATFPKVYTDCIIGKWIYGEGFYLTGLKTFKKIENLHKEIHDLYLVLYKNTKRLYKLFKSKNRIIEEEQIKSYSKLQDLSRNLIKNLENLQNELSEVKEEVL